ncbi:MAG: ribokinase [Actinomycetota bacterium]|jgi:ribokinase
MTSRDRFDVCVVGSANLDLVATVERLPSPGETVPGSSYHEYPGGKGLNQAVAAARSGASVAMVGSVGPDSAGQVLRSVMAADGIDASQVREVDAPTGRALIGVSAEAENLIIVVAGANDDVDARSTPPSAVVLSQLEVPLDAIREAFAQARQRGAMTVLNPAPVKALPDDVLALCDIVVPNEHEVELLGGVDHLLSLVSTAVVVTHGAEGSILHTHSGRSTVAPVRVTPLDTTGAGDCFCGSLSARLAAGDTMTDALRFASAAAALSTTVAGAVPSMPVRDDVLRLLAAEG